LYLKVKTNKKLPSQVKCLNQSGEENSKDKLQPSVHSFSTHTGFQALDFY